MLTILRLGWGPRRRAKPSAAPLPGCVDEYVSGWRSQGLGHRRLPLRWSAAAAGRGASSSERLAPRPPPLWGGGGGGGRGRPLAGRAPPAPAPARWGRQNCCRGQNTPPAPLATDFSCHQGQNHTFSPLAAIKVWRPARKYHLFLAGGVKFEGTWQVFPANPGRLLSICGQLPRLPATSTPRRAPKARKRRSLVSAGRGARRWCQVLPASNDRCPQKRPPTQ